MDLGLNFIESAGGSGIVVPAAPRIVPPTREEILRITAEDLLQASDDVTWFASHCKTHDPHAKKVKLVSFPIHKQYIQALLAAVQTIDRLIIYKSRQMLVTWTLVIYCAHQLLFNAGSYTALISKKEEDSGKLIARMKVVIDNLPAHWALGLPKLRYFHGKKGVPLKVVAYSSGTQPNSVIEAFPSGPDQVRGEAYSFIYWDEVGLADDTDARLTYASLRPTIEGGGRVCLSSTPPYNEDHFFYKLVEGTYFEGN